VQLARTLGAELVEDGESCDLLFDTAGGDALARSADRAGRIVTIAAEMPAADYFVVEPDGSQLATLPLPQPELDSVFPLADFAAAFERCQARGKHGKVVIRIE
jgi:hypothetical protein